MRKVKGNGGRGLRYEFSIEEDAYLREHFPLETSLDVAEHFGISYPVVLRRAKELGLEKDFEAFPRLKTKYRYVKNYKHGWYKNIKTL